MWRPFFLAAGIFSCMLGAQCLMVDKVVLHRREAERPRFMGLSVSGMTPGAKKELVPPDWAPWSLLSLGAVTVLYSFTLPNRAK